MVSKAIQHQSLFYNTNQSPSLAFMSECQLVLIIKMPMLYVCSDEVYDKSNDFKAISLEKGLVQNSAELKSS